MTEETKQEVVPQVVPEEQETKSTLCPYCGYDTSVDPVPIDEEEIKEYFRRMQAGETFSKTYKYMKGDISITLQELKASTTDTLINLIKEYADKEIVLTYAFRAKFMACCTEFRLGDKKIIEAPVTQFEGIEALNEAYRSTVGALPPTISHLAEDALTAFNTLIDGAIQEAITSRDF